LRRALDIKDRAEQPASPFVVVGKSENLKLIQSDIANEEIVPGEKEFQEKQLAINRFLIWQGGLDDVVRVVGERNGWHHIGEDGSVKAVFLPKKGILAEEKVCLRRNVINQESERSSYATAEFLRKETSFLKKARSPHFVRVYAHAPLDPKDKEGFGAYESARHWELTDYVEGKSVDKVWDEKHEVFHYPSLSPAMKLRIVLAACDNELLALNLQKPAHLTDLRPDAFIVEKDDKTIKQIDCQWHDDIGTGQETIAAELINLCLQLFPAKANFSYETIDNAIHWIFYPEVYETMKPFLSSKEKSETLKEIVAISNHVMPDGLGAGLLEFSDWARDKKLKSAQIPARLAEKINPIIEKLEAAEESGSWDTVVAEMAKDEYFISVYGSTGSAVAASAVFQLKDKINDKIISQQEFIKRVNQVVAEMNKRKPPESVKTEKIIKSLPGLTAELTESGVARVAFGSSKSPVAAMVAYELRKEITSGKIGGDEFTALCNLINACINGKLRE
jgi:hypothetical protein